MPHRHTHVALVRCGTTSVGASPALVCPQTLPLILKLSPHAFLKFEPKLSKDRGDLHSNDFIHFIQVDRGDACAILASPAIPRQTSPKCNYRQADWLSNFGKFPGIFSGRLHSTSPRGSTAPAALALPQKPNRRIGLALDSRANPPAPPKYDCNDPLYGVLLDLVGSLTKTKRHLA